MAQHAVEHEHSIIDVVFERKADCICPYIIDMIGILFVISFMDIFSCCIQHLHAQVYAVYGFCCFTERGSFPACSAPYIKNLVKAPSDESAYYSILFREKQASGIEFSVINH